MNLICQKIFFTSSSAVRSVVLLSTCCVLLTVMPTIEKLLNADWKEKLLDKSAGAGQLKGQLSDNSFTIYIPLIFLDFHLILVNVCK